MKISRMLLIVGVICSMSISCTAQTDKQNITKKTKDSENIEVVYFHFTRRCATCNAVEKVSRVAVAELYGDKVSFTDFNLDEEEGKAKSKELKVSGQSLLIVAGNTTIDITNEGFMNARTNPEKLKEIIKQKIDPLL